MTYGKCPFHGMEIGNGNWTGIRNCFPMHLISQMTACLSGITDWAELSLTKHDVPALGDLGKSQKYPLPKRKALFYCHGGRAWNHVLESEKGEIEIIFKKLKGKKRRKITCQKRYFITTEPEPTVQEGFASKQLCQTAVRTSHSTDNQPQL